MKQSSIVVTLAVFSLFFCSCLSSLYMPFKMVDSSYKAKGNKAAVISALFKNDTVLFSTKFENELKKCSKYQIISQKNIKKRLGIYPVKIKGPYTISLKKINHDFSNTDVKTLVTMGKKLKVDYVYAIWAPNAEYNPDLGMYQIHTIMQIFEVATGKEIANAKFPITWQTKGSSIGAKLQNNKNDAMKDIASKLSIHIAEKMGMLKK